MDNRKLLTELFSRDAEYLSEFPIIAVGILASKAIYNLWKQNKEKYEKYKSKCNKKTGKEKEKCLIQGEIEYIKTQIKLIKLNMKQDHCRSSCQIRSKAHIEKLEAKIKKLKFKLKQLDIKK